MTGYKKIGVWMFSLCLMFQMCALGVRAAEGETYGYTVTFYAGNHGTFAGSGSVTVDNSRTGSAYQVQARGDMVTVKNLQYGDRVSFDAAMDGAVTLAENSKYYVKGIRLGGRDNDTVGMSSFEVKGDQDYVVAYGIRGDLTSYVVNYQDTSGRTLAPSRTYYGNVGDRPVVAFLYIEGYEPQAYNLTRTLSRNAAENVFTFQYARVSSGGSGAGGSGSSGGGGAGDVSGGAADGGTVPGAAAGASGTGVSGTGAGASPGGAGDAGVLGGADGDGGGADGADAAEGQTVPDEDVPQQEGPKELQELDDEDVPLAGIEGNGAQPGNMLVSVVISLTAAAALLLLVVLWIKKRKKEGAEDTEE